MRALLLCLTLMLTLPMAARAQDSGGLLVGLLEDSLSGDSRTIKVTGLSGALSSRATIERITVSDNAGVWLTIDGAVLDWNRLALVRGRFVVNTLRADRIEVSRAPEPVPADPELPSPEARPFSLPELPVALNIGEIAVDRLDLGAALAGVAAELKMTGALILEDGKLDASMNAERLDRSGDRLALTAQFDNETRLITLDLLLDEAAGGLVGTTLGLPGAPALRLSAAGSGPVADFTADLQLASDGVQRLGGQVRLRAAPALDDPSSPGGIAFSAQIDGDLRPLLAPDYRAFFGPDTRLDLAGINGADGRISLPGLALTSQALSLRARFELTPGGVLEQARLDATIAAPDGSAVLLPLGGARTSIRAAQLQLGLDAAQGTDWTLAARLDGLQRPDMGMERADITGQGTLEQGSATRLSGTFGGTLAGIRFADAALAQAVGDALTLQSGFDWNEGALALDGLELAGADYSASVTGRLDGLDSGLRLSGGASVAASDLARFSGLAGRAMRGATTARIDGTGSPLGGDFDITLTAETRDLGLGIADLDALITGETSLTLAARRDTSGTELTRFDLTGSALSARASGTIRNSGTDLTLDAALDDLARLVPALPGPVTLKGQVSEARGTLSGDLRLDAPDGIRADVTATQTPDGTVDATFAARLTGLERFVPQLTGDLDVDGTARRENGDWTIAATTRAEDGLAAVLTARLSETAGTASIGFDATLERIERFVSALTGTLAARGTAERADGVWRVRTRASGVSGIDADVAATLDEASGGLDLDYRAGIDDLGRFVPQLPGGLVARGAARRSDSTWAFDATTQGAAGIEARIDGTFNESDAELGLDYEVTLARLQRLVAALPGTAEARGTLALSGTSWRLTTRTALPEGLAATATALFDQASGAVDLIYDAELAQLARFVPGLTGQVALRGTAARADGQWQAKAEADGSAGIRATLDAEFIENGGTARLRYDASLARTERLMADLPGQVSATGEAQRANGVWQVDSRASGPGGLSADITGRVDEALRDLAVQAKGQVQLGLVNRILSPNSVNGLARFDLALNGAPALNALSGTVTTTSTRLVLPALVQVINGIDATLRLDAGRARIDVSGAPGAGGRFSVTGPVTLSAPFEAGLDIDLTGVVLTDNLSYRSTANGRLQLAGPLTGGATLSGRVVFGETEINIASASGSVSAAPIPSIRHIGEPAEVRQTRARAGLLGSSSGGSGPVYGLDVALEAPNRVFARGRGLQAELGGSLLVRGTTAQVVPSGQISMIRGTMDLLGRRLTLDEGEVTLQGQLEPYLRFVATTATSDGEATLQIVGPLSRPRIEVFSTPERPTEEALAMLLFGNRFDDLSPIRIAQLAAQLATLNGSGGGFIDRLRQSLGVDTLDLGTDEDGNAQVGVGAYISDKLYTDVSVNSRGETQLNLNLNVTDNLTLKGGVDNEGGTGIGLFFDKDY